MTLCGVQMEPSVSDPNGKSDLSPSLGVIGGSSGAPKRIECLGQKLHDRCFLENSVERRETRTKRQECGWRIVKGSRGPRRIADCQSMGRKSLAILAREPRRIAYCHLKARRTIVIRRCSYSRSPRRRRFGPETVLRGLLSPGSRR